MNWNCTTTEERLTDYLDGALAPEEAAAFAAHTAGCAACSRMVAEVSALVSRMQQIEPLEVPVHLPAKILDATLGPRKQAPDWRRWFDWLGVIWQPRFGMGAATVAASFAVLFHAFAPAGKKVTLADLNPLAVVRTANRQAHLTYARGVKFVNDLRVVYEIESRLGPQPQRITPVSEPETPQPSQPAHPSPSNDPHQKSQAVPHSDHRATADGGLLAFAAANRWPYDNNMRSRP